MAKPTTLAPPPPSHALQLPTSPSQPTAAREQQDSSPWMAPRPQTPPSGNPQEEQPVPQTLRDHRYYNSACHATSSRATAVTVRELDADDELENEDVATSWGTAETLWADDGEESFAMTTGGPVREADGYEEGRWWRQTEDEEREYEEGVWRLRREPEIIVVAAAEPLLAKRSGDGGAVMAAAKEIEFTLSCEDDGWSGGEVMFDDDFLYEEEIMDPEYFLRKDRQRESGCSVAADMLIRSFVEASQPEQFKLA